MKYDITTTAILIIIGLTSCTTSVKYNLDWLKKNGFGGVEIAWVYPLNAKNKAIFYDFRKLISEKVIDFYSNFDRIRNKKGLLSRGQCSGAPCDIIFTYA